MKNPRRRFIFGYTIVDDLMELWYLDRANVVISQPLSWISNVSVSLPVRIRGSASCSIEPHRSSGINSTWCISF